MSKFATTVWVQDKAKDFSVHTGNIHTELPSGIYRGTSSEGMTGVYTNFSPLTLTMDEYIAVEGSVGEELIADIKTFWEKREQFKEYGFTHKRGYLLYGPPGTGKSSIVAKAAQTVVDAGGLAVIIPHADYVRPVLEVLKKHAAHRNIAVIMEEFEELYSSEVLTILDGEEALDGVVFLCTTNFLDALPPRITSRPGRFDRVIEVGLPTARVCEEFLFRKLGNREEAVKWAELTAGLPFAYLSALVRSVKCMNVDVAKEVAYLRECYERGKNDISRPSDYELAVKRQRRMSQ